jgi:GntP family gluconate:H+ symporter
MSSSDVQLLLTALASVLVLVALIVSRIRMHPLLALLIVSIGVGFATGMEPVAIVKNLSNGAGKTLGAVGVVIALGAMLGKILADSGTTERLANAILSHTSPRMIPWAMTLVAFVIGIPMFFEVGLVVMLPLIFSVARKLESQQRFKGSAYVYVRPDHDLRFHRGAAGHGLRRPLVWRFHFAAHDDASGRGAA